MIKYSNFVITEGFGKRSVSRMESAERVVRILLRKTASPPCFFGFPFARSRKRPSFKAFKPPERVSLFRSHLQKGLKAELEPFCKSSSNQNFPYIFYCTSLYTVYFYLLFLFKPIMVIANFYSYVYNFIVIIKTSIKKITSIFL